MKIRKIHLTGFRNYSEQEISTDADLVFFTGRNGAGKTSILEAIHLLSFLRSFRNVKDRGLIHFHMPHYAVFGDCHSLAGDLRLHVGYGRQEKDETGKNPMQRVLSLNGSRVVKISDFIGKLQTVVFSPDDIAIVDSTPAERRRFIDMLLSSLHPEYLDHLQRYRKIQHMRSELFRLAREKRQSVDITYLDSLDREMAKSGGRLQQRRREMLSDFQRPFSEHVRKISGDRDDWILVYQPSIAAGDTEEGFYEGLKKARENDIRLKQTTAGVHRDRILFQPPGRAGLDLQDIASQGQKRTAALALKMAQYAYTSQLTKDPPVLLIDDVLNELDLNRRAAFIEFLGGIGQALITTTDLSGMEDFIAEKRKSCSVKCYTLDEAEGRVKIAEV